MTFKCDVDMGPASRNVSNGTSRRDGEQLCQIILQSIHNCGSYGPGRFGRTDGRMPVLRTVIVTTVSRLPQAGWTKIVPYLVNVS